MNLSLRPAQTIGTRYWERQGRSSPSVQFFVEQAVLEPLQKLPWNLPIEEWRSVGVRHFDIKRGIGRHPVVFVESSGVPFVIKQLSAEGAKREAENYEKLLARGIHNLVPVGYVVRTESPLQVRTQVGEQYEPQEVGHTVTRLLDRVVPDSLLYRRAFKLESRKRIWDAIVHLFVELHINGVYWGDASLANTLVKFLKVEIPYVGKRTELKAFLADAETVEIHESISDSLREADIQFFLESIDWINEDLRASGMIRDPLATAQDKAYIETHYEKMFALAVRAKGFEKSSGLNIGAYLGPVRDPIYFDTLEKHIAEHKWYISERRRAEVSFTEASRDWLENVFVPICELFQREGVLRFFPGKTASELYVEIMTHKYYLGISTGNDVGIQFAMHDYADHFGLEPPLFSFWKNLTEQMKKILGLGGRAVLGFTEY